MSEREGKESHRNRRRVIETGEEKEQAREK